MMTQDPLSLAQSIDHTLLKPNATSAQFEKLCSEANEYGFASVCVPPTWLKFCQDQLGSSQVKLCTVIGFPLGYSESQAKSKEAELALLNGADELDMVLNISALINGDTNTIKDELSSLREIASGKTLKLILETCYLNDEQKQMACKLAVESAWDFVKTSTGFGTGGATIDDVKLMKTTVGENAKVKASGGIRNTNSAFEMIQAGASRLGTSASVEIVKGLSSEHTSSGNY